jgi:AAA domain
MDKICQRLRSLGAATVRYVAWREAPISGDAADYVQNHTRRELVKLLDGATSNPPEIISAAELMKMTLPEPRWAVKGILPEGLAMLGAKSKLGKSCFGLGLGIAVAEGGKALGKISVEAGDVLYLALEDTPGRLQDRLSRVLGDKPSPSRLYVATEWPKLDDGGLDKLESWLQGHPEARLVVIDVWKRVRQTQKQGANAYGEDYEHLIDLKKLADRYRVTVLVLHHTRKAAADDVFDEISGTQGVAGALDTILVLHRARTEADAELWITGRVVEESHKALRFDAEVWTLIGDAEEVAKSNQRRQMLDAVTSMTKTGEGVRPAEVALTLEWPANRVRGLMFRMVAAGELRRLSNGAYVPANTKPPSPLMPNTRNRGNGINGSNGSNGSNGTRKPLGALGIRAPRQRAGSTRTVPVKFPKRSRDR